MREQRQDARPLTDADYRVLADLRHALRRFLCFSEQAAEDAGLTPQQHQALLAIRAAGDQGLTVGALAERLMLRPHSATGLANRLVQHGLVARQPAPQDRRQVVLALTDQANALLTSLSAIHRTELRRMRQELIALLETL
ncbi:MarR family winged helix-turn-helix transcriptional regulator [Pedomonas mirosovicensis]|uniref:MarR family winged helix-turn-helix transcriptional regulator n=1 Tax=Pedomonas mirosovicensis TaxID=2908641 RepID=UPI00216897D5|nr:MarR family transcriptional regulator [Pedomonas mirosovicensis]MCH8686559.1 MarR family transcriptional regulator [Pedomonas mirosovicensis]